MQDYEFSVLVKLYLFGKKLQALVKTHNSDVMSQSIILRLVSMKWQSVSDIAELLSIKVSAATSKVTELEKLGYLRRVESADKRSHVIDITEDGKNQLCCIRKTMSGGENRHTLGLTKKQAQLVETLVDKIRLE